VAQVLRPEAGELEVRIQARPESVFEFFVDPEKMKRWKGTEAELDPRPGGTWSSRRSPRSRTWSHGRSSATRRAT
jgi:uncharacterized protein YndB with AHSA1/START domain